MTLRLREKLTMLFAALALVPFLVLAFYANRVATTSLKEEATRAMSTLRDSRAQQVEQYFVGLTDFVGDLAYHRTLVEALEAFGAAFAGGPDGAAYAAAVKEFAGPLAHLAETMRVARFYLIDSAGNVVFSGADRPDLGTSLVEGRYRQSPLADVFRRAAAGPAAADLRAYEAAGAPLAFVAGPVKDSQGRPLGVVALEIGGEQIDLVMGAHRGAAADVYLVGPDLRLRSGLAHAERRRGAAGGPAGDAAEKADSPSVREALAGRAGAWTSRDSLGRAVLAAYRPVEVLGGTWALVAETSQAQAFAGIASFRRSIWIFAAGILAAVILIGWFIARVIGAPIQSVVAALSTTTSQIAATVDEHERTAAQQSTAVNETSATMTQLDSTARQASLQAEGAADAAVRALVAANEGQRAVAESLREMDNVREKVQAIAQQILCLSEQTGQIESITRLVGNLAGQTNLLALNAAVEAARAGEHGKGFAVVAGEIRKLADESKRSAERISALVADIQNATNSTVMATEEGMKMVEQGAVLAQKAAGGFDAIIETASSASENAQQINLNVRQQATAVSQVVEAMNTLNESAKETVAGLTQTRAGIQNLHEAAQSLAAMV